MQSWNLNPKILIFLSKRILRIYPAFIVASLICIFIVAPLGTDSTLYFSQLNIMPLLQRIIFLQPPNVPPTFIGKPFPSVNGAMWTIGYEFVCYLTVLIMGISGLIHRRYAWLLITVGLIIAFLILILLQRLGMLYPFFSHLINLDHSTVRLGMFFFSGGSYYLFQNKFVFKPWVASLFGVILFFSMFRWA